MYLLCVNVMCIYLYTYKCGIVYNIIYHARIEIYRIVGNLREVFNLANWQFCGKLPN